MEKEKEYPPKPPKADKYWIHEAIVYGRQTGEAMEKVKVEGKNNQHTVLVYALSTCAWCKMTKKHLKDSDIEYEYVDVDLASDEDHAKIREDIISKGGEPIYPTIIVDDKIVITGFRKDKIKEALGI